MTIIPSINDPDERLAEALQAANQDALNILYDRYSSVLLGVLKKITGDNDAAEEALQNCFLYVWRSKDSYVPTSEGLFTWMMKIASKIGTGAFIAKEKCARNQKPSIFVNNKENSTDQSTEIIEMILFKNISPETAAIKLGVSIDELRHMLRNEINKLRGI